MKREWVPKPLTDLGDLIGYAILLVSEHGAFEGGLKQITETDILIEIGEGQTIAVGRDVLDNDLTELYQAKEV